MQNEGRACRRLNVVVTGRVQGVGFRMSARAEALKLGLTGWMRNEPDGAAVRAVLEGDEGAVYRFLAWCKEGPPLARVTDVAHSIDSPQGLFSGVEIRY
ncbi:MAG: acylphosphatase [Candidatus Promineifilaceae bacterium]|jgi:acylphosphatase